MVKAVSPGQTGSAGRKGWEISQSFLEELIFTYMARNEVREELGPVITRSLLIGRYGVGHERVQRVEVILDFLAKRARGCQRNCRQKQGRQGNPADHGPAITFQQSTGNERSHRHEAEDDEIVERLHPRAFLR